jgi:hypothetical protein
MENNHVMELARAKARKTLALSPSFQTMPLSEQRSLYLDLVKEEMNNIVRQQGLAGAMASKKDKASDLIDDKRHEKDFQDGVDAFEDLVDSVDFPKFVADLLKAVFDANISVMKAQTDDYIRLMKEATRGVAEFIKQIDNTTTFAYLAENSPDEWGISMEEDGQGGEKMALTKPDGEKVDMDDNTVKAKIMEAKIALAKEHRAALREIILMGVTRLVVEKGEVEAGVMFEFKGKRDVEKKDKAMLRTTQTKGTSGGSSGGIIGSIFGGPRVSHANQKHQTQLSVSSTKSTAQDELSAKLSGKVRIQFKTDYFKLDNFAQMYGPTTNEEQKAAAAK